MGAVIPIVSQQAAEEAWEAYRSHFARAVDDPRLMVDKHFMEEKRRLENRWNRLFDRIDG